MAEYIDKQAFNYAIRDAVRKYPNTFYSGLEVARQIAHDMDAADVQPVRHGRWGNRWICSNMTGYEYACSCSECGKPTYRISTLEPMPPYCQNCGAKMDGGD